MSTLVKAGGAVPFEELFQGLGTSHNPPTTATVYFNINRLRRLVEEAAPISFRKMPPGVRLALTARRDRRVEGLRLLGDQPGLVAYLTEHAFIDNRKYCELTGVSPSTALRELSRLSEESVLAREGAGRGVRYRLSRPVS